MHFNEKTQEFFFQNKILDFNGMKWLQTTKSPRDLVELSFQDAVKRLQNSMNKIRIPIGVVGTNTPTPEQYKIAEELGKRLSKIGLPVICGGRAGIMEAVCKGVNENNGISIGLLPEINIDNANKFVSLPLATGIGFARNSIIAAASLCMIAVGGGNGTLSEIAYGLHFGKKVYTINCSLTVAGTIACDSVEEIIDNVCKVIFSIDNMIFVGS